MTPCRNEPCPCGGGRKSKRCHFAPQVQSDFAAALREDEQRYHDALLDPARGPGRSGRTVAMSALLMAATVAR